VVLVLDPSQSLNLIINAVLPTLVAFITARESDSWVKAIVLMVLSAVSGFLTIWLDAVSQHTTFNTSQAVFTIVSGFAVAVLSHFGALSPLRLTGSRGLIQRLVPGGLGAPKHVAAANKHEAPVI